MSGRQMERKFGGLGINAGINVQPDDHVTMSCLSASSQCRHNIVVMSPHPPASSSSVCRPRGHSSSAVAMSTKDSRSRSNRRRTRRTCRRTLSCRSSSPSCCDRNLIRSARRSKAASRVEYIRKNTSNLAGSTISVPRDSETPRNPATPQPHNPATPRHRDTGTLEVN